MKGPVLAIDDEKKQSHQPIKDLEYQGSAELAGMPTAVDEILFPMKSVPSCNFDQCASSLERTLIADWLTS